MLVNLAAQANAIWPQEEPLLARYSVPEQAWIADIGCGSGEISARLARRYPAARVVGVDILPASISFASRAHAALAPRLGFQQGDAFDLQFRSDTFDLVVCRHLTQAVPQAELALQELVRVCKPGGWLHVVSEDYGMLHFPPGRLDPDRLWQQGVAAYSRATNVDERIGRRTWTLLRALGLEALWVDYAIVDTLRVPRDTMATILSAWRDGYADMLQATERFATGEVRRLFDLAIEAVLDPAQYAVWHVPIIGGQKSTR
jgi:ubiquinone/menaquinone biosynthesis C-methylase UbiE